MKVRQLVFLVEPAKRKQISKAESDAKQKAHLEYLEGLWTEGKALLIGPFEDAGTMRGVVLLDVDSKEEAAKIIAKDPWVSSGQLVPDIKPWFVARNVPKRGPKFLDIEPLWLGLLRRPKDAPTLSPDESKLIQAGHMANIKKMAASGDLVLAGPMGEEGELRGIFIFRTKNRQRVLDLVSNDPAIQKRRLRLDLYRWYTAKGTFPLPLKPETASKAPGGPPAAELAAMKKLEYMVGKWEGAGWSMDRAGKKHTFKGGENVQMKLQGRALLVEGLFHDETGAVGHETLAVITYDEKAGQYRFLAYTFNGPPGDYAIVSTVDGWYWELTPPQGPKIRFTADFKDGVWHEVGDVEVNGKPIRFFEMTLKKVS